MSNSGLRLMLVKVSADNGKKFRLFFPISLNVFRELLDSFVDLTSLVCVFTPKTPKKSSHLSVRAVRELLRSLIILLGTINDDGPYDLINVDADNVTVKIKIR
ncbi:MAG: hypothetical protein EOM51_01935 [Clostridia bacterium]|nr:hypothetical protein [Clostridia bacterium]